MVAWQALGGWGLRWRVQDRGEETGRGDNMPRAGEKHGKRKQMKKYTSVDMGGKT